MGITRADTGGREAHGACESHEVSAAKAVCVCVRVCARARVCVCAHACACVCTRRCSPTSRCVHTRGHQAVLADGTRTVMGAAELRPSLKGLPQRAVWKKLLRRLVGKKPSDTD